jgi:hypothetical protein
MNVFQSRTIRTLLVTAIVNIGYALIAQDVIPVEFLALVNAGLAFLAGHYRINVKAKLSE